VWAWITLQEMGKRDDIRGRSTREFDSARLAALTKHPAGTETKPAEPKLEAKPAGTGPLPRSSSAQSEVQQIDAPPNIALGRTTTLDDPMTTGLLAEVARRSQTAEFDEELIKEVLNKIDNGAATSHPHVRRRSR
jgi:hypothetical protein